MSDLSGMTGFARIAGDESYGSWAWEAKSVNGRGLDVRVNTPPGFDSLERGVKAAAAKRFKRGSLQISLRIEMAGGAEALSVNEAALDALTASWLKRTGLLLIEPDALATLMTSRGVLDASSGSIRDLGADEAVAAKLLSAGEDVIAQLHTARLEEGNALGGIMGTLVDEMAAAAEQASKEAQTHPKLLRDRLTKQLAELGADAAIDADRLAAEAALSAAKADVREELDRLSAHFNSARDYLAGGSPIGRKLDFLAQELNREANTLCSKSVSLELTNAGLGLKGLVDQFKEQAANVE
jgi:uncharacterized protein (TIGR00255 family)